MPKDHNPKPLVVLRAPVPADIEMHLALPHSREIHIMYGGDPEIPPTANLARSEGWFEWLRDHPFARIIEVEGRAVGEVRLHSHDEADCTARLAVGLFAEEDLGRGYGHQAIVQTLCHGFDTMALEMIDLRVLEFNERAIRCYTACGFETVARLPRSLKIGEIWHDDLLMEITRQRFLSVRADLD